MVTILGGNIAVSQVPLKCRTHKHKGLVLCDKSIVCCIPLLETQVSLHYSQVGKINDSANKTHEACVFIPLALQAGW